MGWHQGYDLEVSHPQHNFLLASGLCCSNSHSAAYALVAYQTAWLKTHYPAAFMAAVLSADMDNTEKVVILIEECQQMKIAVLPPTLNGSQYKFTVNEKSQLVYGLGALKGAGEAAIEEMIKERQANGAFTGLYDLCKRLDSRKFNRRVLEALCKAGAFDEFDSNRAAHFHELNTALRIAEQHSKMAAAGQNDLFGLNAAHDETDVNTEEAYANAVLPWTDNEQLAAEKSVLGLFLSGHPLNAYQDELKHFIHNTINSLPSLLERSKGKVPLRIAGLVMDCRTNYDRQGKTMALVILDDKTGRLDCLVYSEVYDKYRELLREDNVLIAEGAVSLNSYSGVLRLTADKFYSVEHAREFFAKNLQLNGLSVGQHSKNLAVIKQLHDILLPFRGGRCAITIRYCSAQAKAMVQFGEEWRVYPSDALITQLKVLLGKANVNIIYNK